MIPSLPIPFWEYFDAISLSVLVVVIFSLIITHRKKTGSLLSTVSKTVAHSSRTSLIFSIVMTVFFPLYYAFLWFWVGPLIQMPNIFYTLLVVSAICEMAFVWIPAKGKTNRVHTITAGLVGIMMFILPAIILAYGSGLSTWGIFGIVSFLAIAVATLAVLASRKMHRYTFGIEVTYCASFLAMMSLIAHS